MFRILSSPIPPSENVNTFSSGLLSFVSTINLSRSDGSLLNLATSPFTLAALLHPVWTPFFTSLVHGLLLWMVNPKYLNSALIFTPASYIVLNNIKLL